MKAKEICSLALTLLWFTALSGCRELPVTPTEDASSTAATEYGVSSVCFQRACPECAEKFQVIIEGSVCVNTCQIIQAYSRSVQEQGDEISIDSAVRIAFNTPLPGAVRSCPAGCPETPTKFIADLLSKAGGRYRVRVNGGDWGEIDLNPDALQNRSVCLHPPVTVTPTWPGPTLTPQPTEPNHSAPTPDLRAPYPPPAHAPSPYPQN